MAQQQVDPNAKFTHFRVGQRNVKGIISDGDYMWVATSGGVSRYDGHVFQTLTRRDGLASNEVWGILEAQEGEYWIATYNGVTRYRASTRFPPSIYLDVEPRIVGMRRPRKSLSLPPWG